MWCKSCGHSLPRGSRICPECGASRWLRGNRHVRCRSCGARSAGGLHLCPVCGEVQHPRRGLWMAVVLIISVAVVAYGLVRILPLSGPRDTIVMTEVPRADAEATKEEVVEPGRSDETEPTVAPVLEPTLTWTATSLPVPTATATPRPTASPTDTWTPVPTHTATRVPPTRTPESAPAPRLAGPEDGATFQGRRTEIVLSWEAVGSLGEDEWYGVSLRYWANDTVQYGGAWVKDPQWQVPREHHGKPDPRQPGLQWDITVMRQTGTKPDGGREGVPVGATSETRVFYWD